MLYTFIDAEATGLSRFKDSPIEVAYLTINSDLKKVDSGDLYFYDDSIPESSAGAYAIHGIRKRDLEPYKDKFEVNNRKLFKIMCRGNIIGFNSNSYDIPLICNYLSRQGFGETPVARTIDMMKTLRPVFGKNPKLVDALAYFGIKEEDILRMLKIYYKGKVMKERFHNAAFDVTATALLTFTCRAKGIIKL